LRIELRRQVAIERCELACVADVCVRALARTVLVESAPVGDEFEPAGEVADLLPLELGCVQAVPGDRVARIDVSLVEVHAGTAQARPNAGEHCAAQSLELLAQQELGAIGTQALRAHP
jgi:hypothetical protein